jgi:pimeloyl-ACP methyl ester carboxylesterase
MTRILAFALGALMTMAGPAQAQSGTGQTAAACATLTNLAIPGLELSITKAEWFPAGAPLPPPGPGAPAPQFNLPAFCRLDGVLDRRTGADGASYGIGFALALPAEWNGRFLFQGGGGLNGSVRLPLGAQAAGGTPALARGFAVVSTDTGHTGGGFDSTFMREQQASLDFAYQAVERVALLAKQIIARHYGRPASKSYFAGCSTGGREAMLVAQRHPTYFDGIVAGAPAMRTNFSGIGGQWVAVSLNQVAPKDASGKPQTRQALSDANKKMVMDGLLNACDGSDGVKDGQVFDTLSCKFDPKTLVCGANKVDGCLTSEQAAAVEKAFSGLKDSKGRQVYPRFPWDTGLDAMQGIPGLLHGGSSPVGLPFDAMTMDVDRLAEEAITDPTFAVLSSSWWTNLNTFSNRGGKLLFYHGVSDPWFSALDTVDYFERMSNANGGAAQAANFSRLFLAPGMGHCQGGASALDSFDLLTAVVDWVEKGSAPDAVTATGRAFPGRSRPLCAYPKHAHYKGQGDTQDAKNFECR